MAWSAHEAGHDQPVASMTEHVHHGDHSHEVVTEKAYAQLADADHDGGLVHDHLPVDVLAAMVDVESTSGIGLLPFYSDSHNFDLHRTGDPSTAPDSLLRPPRAA